MPLGQHLAFRGLTIRKSKDEPFQSRLTGKGLAGIWGFFFVAETLGVRFNPGPHGPHSWATSLGSGFIEATGVAALFLLRELFWPKRTK